LQSLEFLLCVCEAVPVASPVWSRVVLDWKPVVGLAVVTIVTWGANAAAQPIKPSRPAVEGCKWERIEDSKVGLAAWVQQCDFGSRRIKLFFEAGALAMQYSDGGGPEALIETFDPLPGESPEKAMQRIFAKKTPPELAKRCVLASYHDAHPPKGTERFSFVPDAAYAKELAAKAEADEVGDPPCGDWGDAPDSIQYFETWPRSRSGKLAFVRIGQDEPLFDEQTLALVEPANKAGSR
jgi:hypothetical protein